MSWGRGIASLGIIGSSVPLIQQSNHLLMMPTIPLQRLRSLRAAAAPQSQGPSRAEVVSTQEAAVCAGKFNGV